MEQIHVDYYEGAFGNTIRIATSKTEPLIFLKELFARLSREHQLEIEMSNLKNVKVTGLHSLCLRQVSTEFELGGNITVETPHDFVWSRSKEGWKECEELVAGLLTSSESGHQYLTSESYDEVLVVVSFNESK